MDAAAVCGATWARKSPTEKARTIALKEGGSMKKKLFGAALKAHERAKRTKKRHTSKTAHHSKGHHHTKKGHGHGHRTQHRCGYCGHTARHEGKHGCLHIDSKGRFCPCRHRG